MVRRPSDCEWRVALWLALAAALALSGCEDKRRGFLRRAAGVIPCDADNCGKGSSS